MRRAGLLRRLMGLAAIIMGAGLYVLPAQAHPHVWVVMRSQLVFANGQATAVRHAWTFDQGYSAFLSQGLDKNGDGKLSREELAELAQTNVESLADMNYFTVAKVSGKAAAVAAPTDYYLAEQDKLLTLHFTLPLKTPAAVKTLSLEVYDSSFFVSFVPPENEDGVTLAGAPEGCKITISKPKTLDADMAKTMTESFFQNLDASSNIGMQFSNRAIVACP
ncbi:MAG: DUF1007 family protein [Beijerinckiaceae bacterium]